MLSLFQEHLEIVTSKKRKVLFMPGLNQAPDSFQFNNPNITKSTLSFNRLGPISLKEDLKTIKNLLSVNNDGLIVAHSLSALLIEWLRQNELIDFKAHELIYVAPAFYPSRYHSKMIRYLTSKLHIPSLARADTRVSASVQASVYFEILDFNKAIELDKCFIKTYVDEEDEMLNLNYLKQLSRLEIVRENKFPHHRCFETIKKIIDN